MRSFLGGLGRGIRRQHVRRRRGGERRRPGETARWPREARYDDFLERLWPCGLAPMQS
jgi:hypothetical protein